MTLDIGCLVCWKKDISCLSRFCEDEVIQVTSWGYDESKNENVLYGWVIPCHSFEVLDNGKLFIEPYDLFIFGEETCYSFGFMMDEIAPSLMKEENKTKEFYHLLISTRRQSSPVQ